MRMRSNVLAGLLLMFCAAASSVCAQTDVEWPMGLRPIGEAQLPKGSPCRRVAESVATAEFVRRDAALVACPGARSSIAIGKFLAVNGGAVVSEVDGFTLISVPHTAQGAGDKKTAGDIVRRGQLRCTPAGNIPLSRCDYSVIARRGGAFTVQVTRPDRGQRSIFFVNGKVRGADVAPSDGGKKQRLVTTTELDLFVVTVGEERYEIPADAVAASGQ